MLVGIRTLATVIYIFPLYLAIIVSRFNRLRLVWGSLTDNSLQNQAGLAAILDRKIDEHPAPEPYLEQQLNTSNLKSVFTTLMSEYPKGVSVYSIGRTSSYYSSP